MADGTGHALKVHQAIARALVDNGVKTLFGLMGEGNLYLTDSFIRDFDGEYVSAANEAGAVLMGLGYSLITGRVGVSTVTVGPAMTNTVTALIQGVKSSTPLVLLAGDTALEDRDSIQSVSQRDFVVAAGAGFEQLRSPSTVSQDIATCLRRAMVERRPIVLNMPTNLQWADTDYHAVRYRIPENRQMAPTGEELDNAVGIIAAARRPIVLAGRGATSAAARAAMLRLAERTGAPVATTVKAKDLFEGEDFNLGIFGTLSHPTATDVIIESDCIIAFGASLNTLTTSHGTFVKGKRVIQANLEASEVGKTLFVDAGLIGDPATTADLIVHWLDEAEIASSDYRGEALKARLAGEVQTFDTPPAATPGAVDYCYALWTLEKAIPKERILVTDGGRFTRHVWKTFRTPGPRWFVPTTDFGSIGLGFGYAVGAAIADKDKPVVLVIGDGGFMNGGLAEFNTAVRHNANLIVILCNDGCYGAEYLHFERRGMDPSTCMFRWPDFAPVAVALGGRGVTVKSDADLKLAAEAIASGPGPLLIELKLDPSRMPGH
jgi:thiamine pyrophosphate-dependent acetolactate synthase large subunit-like protein